MSRLVPNTTQTPNLYIDRCMHLLDEAELKTLLYAVRRILGFHKRCDHISLSQFMDGNGRVDETGEPLEYGTGLSKSTQLRVLNQLVDFGLLILVSGNESNSGKEWALELDDEKIDWGALWDRYEKRKKRGRRRTRPARVAAAAQRQQAELFDSGSTIRPPEAAQGGSTIEPQVVQPLDPPGGSTIEPQVVQPLDPQKKEETKNRNKGGNKENASPGKAHPESPNGRQRQTYQDRAWSGVIQLYREEETAVALLQAQQDFVDVTGRKHPYINGNVGAVKTEWWQPLYEMFVVEADGDRELFRRGLSAVVKIADAPDGFTLATPKSAVKTFRGEVAKIRRGNGRTAVAETVTESEYGGLL